MLPLPALGEDNYVLLSSLDETVIQHGAEFNLGIHKYGENCYSPNGHKYIRQFDCEVISRTIYRVGGVVLSKERMLVSFEPRVLIRYQLLEAHSPTTIRLRPFLAFRSVNELTHANDIANTAHTIVENGIAMGLYPNYPQLHMQFSKKSTYEHNPNWYKGIEYQKEQERGFEYKEDLMVPGYFEMPMKKGEEIIFSAGITEVKTRSLKALWNKEMERRHARVDMLACLKNSAQQFYKRNGDKCHLIAGYPWFKAVARDEFIALPACTFLSDREDYWELIVDNTAVKEIKDFIAGEHKNIELKDLDAPDALLWFIRALQMYGKHHDMKQTAQRYGALAQDIISFIRKQQHPRVILQNNGLLYVDGIERPATWMNAVENNRPITPRTGYVVEINALWYNALKFTAELARLTGKEHAADLMDYQAEITRESFVNTFWNGFYLYDYVADNYQDTEVRPNMIYAVSLPYSPLDKKQQKSVVDICTKELLTPKGLRTLSPKSGYYRPEYIGGQLERDRNYHNGPVWPSTMGAYASAYLKIYQRSGQSFIHRMLLGFEAEMSELCIGSLNELYDGNPPFRGHGGMSFAQSVAAIIEMIKELEDNL